MVKLDHLNIDLDGDGIPERYELGGGGNTNEREISWEDYKNLSEEDQNNGTTYYVPDAPGGGSGGSSGGGGTAQTTTYDNQNSGLKATNVQDAIDEIAKKSGIYLDGYFTDVILVNTEVVE